MAHIEVKNLSYKYPIGKTDVLKNLNFTIEKGEFCSIIGCNGSGKTTLCSALRGFVPNFYKGDMRGEILVNGQDMSDFSMGELAVKIGYVFQNPFIQISGIKSTVFEEVAYGLENLGIDPEEIKARVEKMLDFLQINYLRDKDPFALSGGQKQRVALASILVMEPEILVIDEPTSQLDPIGTEEVFQIIKLMKEMGKTIILVEHKIELVAEYSDHVILLDDGEIVMDGPVQEVLSNPKVLDHKTAIPQYASLCIELKKRGYPVEDIAITEEQCIAAMDQFTAKEAVQ